MRILSLVLAVCLVFGAVAYSPACDSSLYDCPIYGPTYPATPDTEWIPVESEGYVPASLVLHP